MDSAYRDEAPVDLEGLLEGVGQEYNCLSVALYETGYTLRSHTEPDTKDPHWTGNAYFIVGWTTNTRRGDPGELQGFPATLQTRGCDSILAIVRGTVAPTLLSKAEFPAAFASSATAEAACLIAIRIEYNSDVPTFALLFFEHETAATDGADRLDPPALKSGRAMALLRTVREAMERQAAAYRISIIGQLQEAFLASLGTPVVRDEVKRFEGRIGPIVQALANHLGCPDLRIYLLEDCASLDSVDDGASPIDEAPRFRLVWQSWTAAPDAIVTSDARGPLAWVLAHRKPFIVHNRSTLLAREGERPAIQNRFPGLDGIESYGIGPDRKATVPLLPLPEAIGVGAGRAGASLLINPISIGDRVIGIALCNGRSRAPFVFDDRDEQAINIVVRTLAVNWFNIELRRVSELDRDLLVRAAEEINKFSRWIAERLKGGHVEDELLYRQALTHADIIARVNRPFSSIRIFDPATKTFRFSGIRHGQLWNDPKVRQLAEQTFPVTDGDPANSVSAVEFVYRSRFGVTIQVAREPAYFRNAFRGYFKNAVYVPVFLGGSDQDIIALIDVRTPADDAFPRSILQVMRELADVLGLAVALAHAHRDLNRTHQELVRTHGHQVRAFEDLAHQILTPHRNTRAQLDRLLTLARRLPETPESRRIQMTVLIARGQLRRASSVGRSAELFAELSRTTRIDQKNKETIKLGSLQDLLYRLTNDCKNIVHPSRNIDVSLDSDSLTANYRDDIEGDLSLLEQAVSNLLENADKYSFKNGRITVSGTRSHNGSRFIIEVTNVGYEIRPHERKLITLRSYRGEAARVANASGHGLGLWLVDAIMLSFGGSLEIAPSSGPNEPHTFRLLFARRGMEAVT